MITWLLACHDPPPDTVGERPDPSPPVVVDAPVVTQPNALVPFARELAVGFDRDVTLTVSATDGDHSISIVATGTSLVVPLIGLYADREWTVDLVARTDHGGEIALDPVSFRTEVLPEPFPHLALRTDDPSVTGLTLLPLTAHDLPYAWLVVVDDDGEVAWLYDGEGAAFLESRVVDGGIYTIHSNQLIEFDWLGRDRRRLSSDRAEGPPGILVEGATVFTHELSETPRGTWLALTKEPKILPAVPVSYESAETAAQLIADDVVMEIDPDDGRVLERWSVADHLDPGRIGYGSLDPGEIGVDWSHSNAVSEHDGRWLVSVRHQDVVVDVDIATGEIRWILGNHDGWSEPFRPLLLEPVGEPFAWSWHQHAAKWLGDGRILMFDNGNFGASPLTGDLALAYPDVRSRAVLYTVDEVARTVRQEAVWTVDPPLTSGAMGDTDLLSDGHVLVTWAYVQREGGERNDVYGRTPSSVRVAEFDTGGAVVWDLDVWGEGVEPGWQSFRADRFAAFSD